MPENKKDNSKETTKIYTEKIVGRMENGEMDVDAMTEELKTAKKIIKACRDKLTKTDEEIKKILG